MRAVVVYESMYGNTRAVAEAIGNGLRTGADVSVVSVVHADEELLRDADLLVVGGPTHVHGVSRPSTRKAAIEAAGKPSSGLSVEPDAEGAGLREWIAARADLHLKAATFDTRMSGPVLLTGHASRGIARLLRARGAQLVGAGESFLVTKANRLASGELERAEGWGTELLGSVRRNDSRLSDGDAVGGQMVGRS